MAFTRLDWRSFLGLLRVTGLVDIETSSAACLWLYSTFDNVDGKQARRTGSSSPLGELFDHGCDALNCSVRIKMCLSRVRLVLLCKSDAWDWEKRGMVLFYLFSVLDGVFIDF